MRITRYGLGGYKPGEPNGNMVEEIDSVTGLHRTWNDAGALTDSQALTVAETAAFAAADVAAVRNDNERTIVAAAKGAAATNTAYLAIGTPSAAQVAAQVRALTQQNSRIIPLLLSLLGDRSQLDGT